MLSTCIREISFIINDEPEAKSPRMSTMGQSASERTRLHRQFLISTFTLGYLEQFWAVAGCREKAAKRTNSGLCPIWENLRTEHENRNLLARTMDAARDTGKR